MGVVIIRPSVGYCECLGEWQLIPDCPGGKSALIHDMSVYFGVFHPKKVIVCPRGSYFHKFCLRGVWVTKQGTKTTWFMSQGGFWYCSSAGGVQLFNGIAQYALYIPHGGHQITRGETRPLPELWKSSDILTSWGSFPSCAGGQCSSLSRIIRF